MARDQAFNNCACSNIRNQNGFSLIECLIYSAITSLISIILFSFLNNAITSLNLISGQEYDSFAAWTAQQLLSKDIQMADAHSEWWHTEPDTIICRIAGECIGWQLHKGSLYRLKGDYDYNTKQWRHKSSALVIQNVKHFMFGLNKQEKMVSSIHYELETTHNKQIKTIVLENRRIN